MAGKLHGKIAREPVGALDEDYPHAIAGDPVEHGLKAGALVDWVDPLTQRHRIRRRWS